MKSIKALGLICFLTIGILAQQSAIVTGQLVEDGKNITNQTIKLVSKTETFETTTDFNGFYQFANIKDGSYLLVYDGKQARVTVENGKVSTEELADVVVVSANTTQTLDQVSKTVNVIDGQELRDRADFSLVESLRTIPGFRVQQLGGFGRTASIKSRGLRNQDTALLLDGVRFRDAASITGDASAFLSDFTFTSVSRIEVLRGSGSSIYGTNAVGGTIDLQTPTPQTGWHGQVSANGGGLGFSRFRGNISKGTDNGKFGFNAAISRTDYRKGIDGDDNADNTNFQSRIELKPFQKTNISVRFFVSDAFVRLNSSPDTFGALPVSNATIIDANPGVNFIFDADDPDNSQKSRFFNGQVVLSQVITDKLYFQSYYSGLKTKRTNDNGPLGDGFQPFGGSERSIFDGTIQTANGHIDWTPDKINRVTAGYEFEYEKFGNDGFSPDGTGDFSTDAGQSSNTVYAQDLIGLLDGKLQFSGGFRVQFFDLKTPEFSLNNAPYTGLTLENPPTAYTFDGSASYFFSRSGTKLRTHIGSGYRVPSLYERFGSFFNSFAFPNPRFEALGDPNLKPERSIAFEGGVEQNLFNNRAKLTATYFYTKLTDIIGFGFSVPDIGSTTRDFGGYRNQKGGIARGGEFSGNFRPTSTTEIFASYTFTNSDQRQPQVGGTGILSTLGVPENQFTLVATQRFDRFWVNFDFLATSDYLAPISNSSTFMTYIYRFDGNRKADLTAGYTFPLRKGKFNLRVYGTVENLFDQEYFENGFRTAGITARGGINFGF